MNITDLGGRAVLMVYKNGKLVYHEKVNELNRRQKRIGKFMAKQLGNDA